ncbi:MAG: hypothetical protein FWG92_05505 [Leptospirales bacterium]|nr:hypothetical protein [Leptospirales bacterium]
METKNKPYLVVIYGKDACDKCAALRQDVALVLEDRALSALFDADYQNLSTAKGMAAYALAETVNGQRLPTVQIMEYNTEKKAYVKMPDSGDGYLQLQTDYAPAETLISRADITALLDKALKNPAP